MAQKEANHSSKDKTVLWIILPCTVAVSLLFTKLNHNMVPVGEKLSANFENISSQKSSVAPAEKADSVAVSHSEAEHPSAAEEKHH